MYLFINTHKKKTDPAGVLGESFGRVAGGGPDPPDPGPHRGTRIFYIFWGGFRLSALKILEPTIHHIHIYNNVENQHFLPKVS